MSEKFFISLRAGTMTWLWQQLMLIHGCAPEPSTCISGLSGGLRTPSGTVTSSSDSLLQP